MTDREAGSSAELRLREMISADVEAVVCLWRDAGLTRPWNDPFADAERALSSPASTVVLAFEPPAGGRLAGSVMVGFDGHRGWVYYLAVAEAQRGRGIARTLMRAAEDWLIARDAPKVQLMVRAENTVAVGFYRAIGYGLEDRIILSRWLR